MSGRGGYRPLTYPASEHTHYLDILTPSLGRMSGGTHPLNVSTPCTYPPSFMFLAPCTETQDFPGRRGYQPQRWERKPIIWPYFVLSLLLEGVYNCLQFTGYNCKNGHSSLGGLEPPTFRLTAERANRLRHRDPTGL